MFSLMVLPQILCLDPSLFHDVLFFFLVLSKVGIFIEYFSVVSLVYGEEEYLLNR